MTDENLKHVLQDGIKTPSADFTSGVMDEIRKQGRVSVKPTFKLYPVMILGVLLYVLASLISLSPLELYGIRLQIPTLTFQIIASLCMLYGLYHYLNSKFLGSFAKE